MECTFIHKLILQLCCQHPTEASSELFFYGNTVRDMNVNNTGWFILLLEVAVDKSVT